MAVRALVVWAAAGGLAMAGSSAGAAPVRSLGSDDPVGRVAAMVVVSESADLPVAAKSSPAAPRDSADTSFFDPVAGLESDWITFELAYEPYGSDDHPDLATTEPSNADWHLLSGATTVRAATIALSGSISRPTDPGFTGRTIALPSGMVTGGVGLVLLLGRGLLRRGWDFLR